MDVAIERWTPYFMLSIGDSALRARFTAFGVTARFTARPGCMARRTPRGTSSLEKKPTLFTPEDPLADQMVRPAGSDTKLATLRQSVLAAGPRGFITAHTTLYGKLTDRSTSSSFIPANCVQFRSSYSPPSVVLQGNSAAMDFPRMRGDVRATAPASRKSADRPDLVDFASRSNDRRPAWVAFTRASADAAPGLSWLRLGPGWRS